MENIWDLLGQIPEAVSNLKDIIFKFFSMFYEIINLLPNPFNTIFTAISSTLIGVLVFKIGKKLIEVIT